MSVLPVDTAPPYDPLRPAPGGVCVEGSVVVVRRRPMRLEGAERWVGRTTHFGIGRLGARLVVVHGLGAATVSADVAALVAAELFAPGWVVGADAFERIVAGIVRTCHEDPGVAWEAFYRNTMRRIAGGDDRSGLAPVHERAAMLVREAEASSVIDLGSCFGFLPLDLAAGRSPSGEGAVDVWSCDVAPGTSALLAAMACRLGIPVRTLCCDAACVPLPDRSVDAVTCLHLLEHVDGPHGARIVAEAARLARRRVVVAVPYEAEPDPTFGHVRTLGPADLAAAAEGLSGWRSRVEEHHGGWLVLDRVR